MLVFKWFLRFLAGVFSCRHWRTRIHEGKCYCPDCGRGLIFQWVALRCAHCQRRVESRLWFGRISPVQRCCARCGHSGVDADWLSEPAYFQLHKAQLVLVAEEGCRAQPWGACREFISVRLAAAVRMVPRATFATSVLRRLAVPAR